MQRSWGRLENTKFLEEAFGCDAMGWSGAEPEISVPCQCQKDILNTKLKVRATGPYCIATSTFTTQHAGTTAQAERGADPQ